MGEIKDAQKTEGVLRQTHIGGQALIEGIMMRGRYNWAVAVREPDGSIYTEEHDLISGRDKNSWMYKPVVRGCTALVESLFLCYKALEISANHAYDFSEEEDSSGDSAPAPEASVADTIDSIGEDIVSAGQCVCANDSTVKVPAVAPDDAKIDTTTSTDAVKTDTTTSTDEVKADTTASKDAASDDTVEGLGKAAMTGAMVLGILLGIVIFAVLPAVITNFIIGDYGEKTLTWNLVDGVLRIVVFITYIWLISLMKDIKRMFAYHGAEHKTIHCFEHGADLTPQNAAGFPRLHVRCGTAFLLITMIIAIFVFTVFPTSQIIEAMDVTNGVLKLCLVILSRIVLMPLVAGLAYEVTVKWAGSRPENPLVKVVLWPGMQMQRLTTNQPDEGMLECAIVAMNLVLAREEREKAAGSQPTAPALSPCEVAANKQQ